MLNHCIQRCPSWWKQSTRKQAAWHLFAFVIWERSMVDEQECSSMVTQKAKHTHTLYPCGKKLCGYISSEEHQAELMFPLDLECLAYFLSSGLSGGQETHTFYGPPGLPISHFLSKSLCRIHTHDTDRADICCVVSVEQLEGAQVSSGTTVCSCVRVCMCAWVSVSVGVQRAVWECLCLPFSSSWQSCCWAHSLATAAADG